MKELIKATKRFTFFFGNPAYVWDGQRVTSRVLTLHDWRLDNCPLYLLYLDDNQSWKN